MGRSNKSEKDIKVIGIGASAGGLEALQVFFKHMQEDSGLAFVVVQHLSPDYKSLMDELLARQTKMPIIVIKDGTTIKKDTVYLIPPRKNLRIFKNKLFLSDQDPHKGLNLPIDIFFKSLAEEREKDAIGIVLSGTGSDGTMGTRAIKELGGMIMAQNEESAKFYGMPSSSIATGLVDYILPPNRMPDELLDYIKHPFIKKSNLLEIEQLNNLDTLTKVIFILRDHTGIDFSYYKENTIIRRLERRVSINHFKDIEEYLVFLNKSEKEKDTLYRELLIGVTHFFRDTEAFKSLSEKVIPKLLDTGKNQIRIWSTGCSTGEEVYSIAISFLEIAEKVKFKGELKIFATDIDRHSLEIASQGFYPESIVGDIDPILLNKYFSKVENGYNIKDEVRNLVVFAPHNLLKDPPFSKLDLLICRNLFIYLKPDIQARILSRFYYSLNPSGYLFMGSSETLGNMSDGFSILDSKNKIFQYSADFQPPPLNDVPLKDTTGLHESKRYIDRKRTNKRSKSDRILDQVIDNFVPPSILIDSNNYIVNILNDINPFIEIQSGQYSNDLFSLLPNDLSLFVNNLLRQLRKEKHVVYRNVSGIKSFKKKNIRIEGRLLEVDGLKYYMLTFNFIKEDKDNKSNIEKADVLNLDDEQNARVIELEKELQSTKENLAATVEELETSNEELQSSNEELIASNEELQSTNEELQSVNEELYTVNSEYQSKIEELTNLNNDINNLLHNTEVAALYLDSQLLIRKITPEIKKITNILDSDIGRSITHIKALDAYGTLIEDVKTVLENLQPIDKEITDNIGRTFFARIRPYRKENNVVDGVLVTFVNISKIKSLEQEIGVSNERLRYSLKTGNMAWWEWDVKTGEVLYDEKKATMLGYTDEEFPNDVYKICDYIHPDDYVRTMNEMKKVLENKTNSWEAIYRMKKKDGTYLWYSDSGKVKQRNDSGKPVKIVGTVVNINYTKDLQEDLHLNQQLVELIIENTPTCTVMTDSEGKIKFANKEAEKLFKLNRDEISKRDYKSPDWKILDLENKPIQESDLPFSIIKKTKKTIHNFKHYIVDSKKKKILITIDGSPVINSKGEFEGAVFTIRALDYEGKK